MYKSITNQIEMDYGLVVKIFSTLLSAAVLPLWYLFENDLRTDPDYVSYYKDWNTNKNIFAHFTNHILPSIKSRELTNKELNLMITENYNKIFDPTYVRLQFTEFAKDNPLLSSTFESLIIRNSWTISGLNPSCQGWRRQRFVSE